MSISLPLRSQLSLSLCIFFFTKNILSGGSNTNNTMLYNPWQKRYDMQRGIAVGKYGTVKLARDKETGSMVAMKTIPMICSREGVTSFIIREIAKLKELEHETSSGDSSDSSASQDLHSFLRQILTAVAYCHSNKILHRDLKPYDVLIDVDKKTVKIADFGCARNVEVPPNVLTNDRVGTACYRAPELLLGSTSYTEAVDIWSVGCMFAEMIMRRPIFNGMGRVDVLVEIFKYFGVPSEETWPGVRSLRRNISTAYEIAPGERKNLQEAIRGLDADGLELLKLMLSMNPTSRISAAQALGHRYLRMSST